MANDNTFPYPISVYGNVFCIRHKAHVVASHVSNPHARIQLEPFFNGTLSVQVRVLVSVAGSIPDLRETQLFPR